MIKKNRLRAADKDSVGGLARWDDDGGAPTGRFEATAGPSAQRQDARLGSYIYTSSPRTRGEPAWLQKSS
jgi:hypothetical protein